MQPPRAPVFLARETYRRRRLIDALRLLPVIGVVMFLSPLVGGAGYVRATAVSGVFIFAGWFLLIVATWGLGRLLARSPGSGDPLETGGDGREFGGRDLDGQGPAGPAAPPQVPPAP
ncbi:MAG: hypothetical protein KDK11_03300 [Maritimibacter sp.]|nr:hypothetical protein [Maritimibacter sp.]